jgi:hypothetical protein
MLLMPNSKHLTHSISNLVSLITKTKLGLSEPKSNKHKSNRQDEESSAQVANRSFPLSNLTSLAQILDGLNLEARGEREMVSQCLGALFSAGEPLGMGEVTVRKME